MEIRIVISDSATGGGGATQESGLTFAQAAPSGATAPGATALGATAPDAPASVMTGGVVQPPDYLARAAAALGARNGGPAPMLSGLGGAAGEPVQFTSAAIASPAMAAAGAPDQSAGAAPGAERAVARQTVQAEEADEDEEP
jgi:hypothetical protein